MPPASFFAAALVPSAAADPNLATYSNATGDVRCEMYQTEAGTETICVSETARQTQPECNPPQQLIPAVTVNRDFVGTNCWNQGFVGQPQKLNPLQVRRFGTATVIPGFSGNLYVLDITRRALVRAGSTNTVLFNF
ncbi:hypothetical protein GC584_09985 [Corynebacterium sp. zg912]|uniref:Uncharacterized protein n=1 Tax=Corynebacterium wankanglinii TaxID=2735136 RepID=A0A7H0KBC4_9CORY|nr:MULTISPECIES: hypothetical protein [Corynebacterium]MBA1838347.1 hypothetical protein [Corynebacterium wankanglinii]MCR5929724.1 hypothetical protein [Corynebacterium sp. zg912]QNP94590.1 hypothetical protein IA203_03450 [Corynebacterium wankanglinii]